MSGATSVERILTRMRLGCRRPRIGRAGGPGPVVHVVRDRRRTRAEPPRQARRQHDAHGRIAIAPVDDDTERLACIATLANSITDALAAPSDAKAKRATIERLIRSYGSHFADLDGSTRAFFLLKDPSATVARFRFGFGQSAPEMRAWTAVPLSGVDDVFSLVMRQYKDLVIKNASAPEVSALLPEWYRQHMAPRRYLVLLPLVVDQKALGFFYIDGDESNVRLLTPALLNYLKVLRGQAVVAIRQKSARADTRRSGAPS